MKIIVNSSEIFILSYYKIIRILVTLMSCIHNKHLHKKLNNYPQSEYQINHKVNNYRKDIHTLSLLNNSLQTFRRKIHSFDYEIDQMKQYNKNMVATLCFSFLLLSYGIIYYLTKIDCTNLMIATAIVYLIYIFITNLRFIRRSSITYDELNHSYDSSSEIDSLQLDNSLKSCSECAFRTY